VECLKPIWEHDRFRERGGIAWTHEGILLFYRGRVGPAFVKILERPARGPEPLRGGSYHLKQPYLLVLLSLVGWEDLQLRQPPETGF